MPNTRAAEADILAADENPAAPEDQADLLPGNGNTLEAEAQYVPNQRWQDFEVHFFVALPFTALYSYLTVLTLDGAVQSRFPPELRQADLWVVMGLAAGSAFAVALGSIGRVPDQSVPRTVAAERAAWPEDRGRPPGGRAEIASIQIRY